jgi:hypothetical protein
MVINATIKRNDFFMIRLLMVFIPIEVTKLFLIQFNPPNAPPESTKLLTNSLSRKGFNLALLNLNIKLYGVTTHLAVFDEFLFRHRPINPFELLFPTMRAGEILLNHKIKLL